MLDRFYFGLVLINFSQQSIYRKEPELLAASQLTIYTGRQKLMRIFNETVTNRRGGLYLPVCASQWQAGAHPLGQIGEVFGRE